ncbi:hypothetical protein IV203_010072 [Nitzschia inconspicua]|uniref:Uncharacterized protein n=1 Tax=Nitzschia inconspicua TaxID=303405 RepID=A0A9K3PK56_9STRA|nr:hypothetical protein IV203_010072 [Nitzschia inconspicua]
MTKAKRQGGKKDKRKGQGNDSAKKLKDSQQQHMQQTSDEGHNHFSSSSQGQHSALEQTGHTSAADAEGGRATGICGANQASVISSLHTQSSTAAPSAFGGFQSQSSATRIPDLHRYLSEQLMRRQIQEQQKQSLSPNLQNLVEQLLSQQSKPLQVGQQNHQQSQQQVSFLHQLQKQQPTVGNGAFLPIPLSPAGMNNASAVSNIQTMLASLLLWQNQNTAQAGPLPTTAGAFSSNNSTASYDSTTPISGEMIAALLSPILRESLNHPATLSAATVAAANHSSMSTSDSSISQPPNNRPEKKPRAQQPKGDANNTSYWPQQQQEQQLLDLSSNDASSSSSEQQQQQQQQQQQHASFSNTGQKQLLFPCRARAVPPDHNSKTAVLRIPPDVKHGHGLVCSHEGCQRKGIKFLYCVFCKTPVAKANFGNRHKHGENGNPSKSDSINSPKDPGGGSSTFQQKNIVRPDYDNNPIHLASNPTVRGETPSRKRERPPESISISPKGHQQDKSKPTSIKKVTVPELIQGKVAATDRLPTDNMSSMSLLSSSGQEEKGKHQEATSLAPTQSGSPVQTIDWNNLMSGGLRRMSTSERLDLWRYMLESRPSPESSPRQSAEDTDRMSVSAMTDSRALSEWMDRILWLSDPLNWPSEGSVDTHPASQQKESDENQDYER